MENKKEQFKPFDRVLVQNTQGVWMIDFYSNWNEKWKGHQTFKVNGDAAVLDDDILPYEGNEHLVGTTDKPEAVKLEEGEWIMANDDPTHDIESWDIRKYDHILSEYDLIVSVRGYARNETMYRYAVRFKDFNPDNMEETKKHILCVKNGRIIKYKG